MFVIYETRFLNRAWKRPDDTINQHVKFHKAEDLRKGNKPCACFHFESCADASFDLHTVCYFYLCRGLKITVAKNVVLFTKSVCVILHSFKFHSVCHLCVYINQNKLKKLETNLDRSMKAEIRLSCFYSPLSCQMGKLVYWECDVGIGWPPLTCSAI